MLQQDFKSRPPNSFPTGKILTDEPQKNGLPVAVKLSDEGIEFFTSSENDDENTRTLRRGLAESLLPECQHHLEQLVLIRRNNEQEKEKYAVCGATLRFNDEVAFKKISIPLLTGSISLFLLLVLILILEFSTCAALIRETSIFETLPADPRLPPIEPALVVCIGLSLVPVAGLFLVLEFFSLAFQKTKPRKFYYFLVIIGGVLSVSCTWSFAFVVGGGLVTNSEVGASYQSEVPPWWFFGLTTSGLAFLAAITGQGLKWMVGQFFILAPSNSQFSAELEDAGNHILECIKATSETIGLLSGVVKNIERTGKRTARLKQLQSEISNLNLN